MGADTKLGSIGDKVGYRLLEAMGDNWVDVDGYEFDTIGEAVAMLEDYQEEAPGSTFAVGRVQLAMISRPDEATA